MYDDTFVESRLLYVIIMKKITVIIVDACIVIISMTARYRNGMVVCVKMILYVEY